MANSETHPQIHPLRPVLVGQGQQVQRPRKGETKQPESPMALMETAARRAAQDSGLGEKLWPHIDAVLATRFIMDSGGEFPSEASRRPFGNYANPPALLAKRLGIETSQCLYGAMGGNCPQHLINHAAEMLASGEATAILLAGSEALHSYVAALKEGRKLDWGDDAEGGEGLPSRQDLGESRDGVTAAERALGLEFPINAYPLFEMALMHQAGRGVAEHQAMIGELMAPLSALAAEHPQAWFPTARSAEEIARPSADNRYIGFPYTKYMNAVMRVDQGAALVMMTAQKARELGIGAERQVFLHGGAGANDLWFMSERENFHSSPAIRRIGAAALEQAGWNISEIDYFDLYSCFPSAVQIARAELGIAAGDKRPLSITGGLPYFGGAGNNYAMHSVATMFAQLRAKPGSKGLCTANGWFITKHALGLYSTTPPKGAWESNYAGIQQAIDSAPHPPIAENPQGEAILETYTIRHGRKGIEGGICYARLKSNGARFPARLPDDKALWARMMKENCIGASGTVETLSDGTACFTPQIG